MTLILNVDYRIHDKEMRCRASENNGPTGIVCEADAVIDWFEPSLGRWIECCYRCMYRWQDTWTHWRSMYGWR